MATASPIPARFMAGVQQDQPWQPLSNCGAPNPAFYHTFFDDFDLTAQTALTNFYAITLAGTGAAVSGVAGDGGRVLFTGPTTTGNATLQTNLAGFTVNSLPKKFFFECRVALSAWATAGITAIFGLIQDTATPATVTDGVYFALSAAGILSINSMVGSVLTSAPLQAGSYTLTGGAFIDLGFEITRNGDVLAYVDSQLVGFVPQSLLGTVNNPKNVGPVSRLTAPTLTAVNLCPTLSLLQTSTTAVTMTADFITVSKER